MIQRTVAIALNNLIGLVVAVLIQQSCAFTAFAASPNAGYLVDPATVTTVGPAWKYPQAGWRVVHVEGKPYDRGYQHGHLLAAEIVDYITMLATCKNHENPELAWKEYRLFVNALFLRRFDQEQLEEMKGIADGAAAAGAKFDSRRLDLLDIVTVNADVEASFLEESLQATANGLDAIRHTTPQYSSPKIRHHEKCSAFAAVGPATRDGKIVIGHITMSELNFVSHYNIWLDIQPDQGHRMVFQTFPGGIHSGMDFYLASSGLVIAETTLPQTFFRSDGKTISSRIRRAVQYGKTIDDVVAILKDSNNGLYANEWLIADINTNEVAMLELGTHHTKLWRSSKNEWPSGTAGFYWSCNNTKDRDVLRDTVPDLRGKPANLIPHPHERDRKWLQLFDRRRGAIDEAFGFEAFTTAPIAAYPSCDAKFTTTELARQLKAWGIFGPPRGKTWQIDASDREKNPDVKPLVSNDWTMLTVAAPTLSKEKTVAVDLDPFPDDTEADSLQFDQRHPLAWRGTLLPKSNADIWLAAAFAEFEKVVAFENALKQEADGEFTSEARQQVAVARFTFETAAFAAERRLQRSLPLTDTIPDFRRVEWYDVAVGKGVRLLAALREKLGAKRFDGLMDEFGVANAGKEVSAVDFRQFVEKNAGENAAAILQLDPMGKNELPKGNLWSIRSYEHDPEAALIVYGTLADVAAQREAAELLRHAAAKRFYNHEIQIIADKDLSDAQKKSRHLLLVGGPQTNRVAAQCDTATSVVFRGHSFVVANQVYAHPDSAVIAAGQNPWSDAHEVVIFAGLSASATWHCVQTLSPDDTLAPQIVILPAKRAVKKLAGNL